MTSLHTRMSMLRERPLRGRVRAVSYLLRTDETGCSRDQR